MTNASDNSVSNITRHIGFLLMPEYTLSTFANAISVLRMANRLSGDELYKYSVFSSGGVGVKSSSGVEVIVDSPPSNPDELNILVVCGGYNVSSHCDKKLINVLRSYAKKKIPIAGICTGSYVLAAAGLLDGYRCTIHWENLSAMREQFPQIEISSGLFVIDRDRYTCSGGISSIDLMLSIVASIHGHELVQQISEQFTCERVRTENDPQRAPLRFLIGASQPRLVEAVALMEDNIEEPLRLDVISETVGISRRQLERLFNRYLRRSPSRYYLELRLSRARLLLLQSSMPMIEIAISCGFSTAPHFSKCYSEIYGNPPSKERILRA